MTLAITVQAQDCCKGENPYKKYTQDLPFGMLEVKAPVIPERQVNLKDFGAVGDGATLCTDAFAKAIEALSNQGGGHLIVPNGVWFTGPIILKSNIDLHLEMGAVIKFSADESLYAVIKTSFEGLDTRRCQSPLSANGAENIAITGQGVIDGNGQFWRPVKKAKMTDAQWKEVLGRPGGMESRPGYWVPNQAYANAEKNADMNVPKAQTDEEWNAIKRFLRPVMVSLVNCKNVLLKDVIFQNSPAWNIHPMLCESIIIDGVLARNPAYAQNGDALDLESCKNALVVNSKFDAGDDGICMKGGAGAAGEKSGPCENILIQDNTVYHAHGGFVVGSEFSGGMKNIVVRRCLFSGTDTGLRFKSAIGRGGKTENIHISDITMSDIRGEAIIFETTYWDNHVGAKKDDSKKKLEYVPDFGDIHISNIVCRGCKTAIAAHGEEGMIHDITVQDAIFFYTKNGTDIDAACGVTMKNVRLETFEK